MSEQFYTLLTLTGQAKIANANVLGNKVNFSTIKVGDGGGVYYNPTQSQTDVVNKVWEGAINSIYVDENNANWVVIESIIPGDVGGFTVREAGVFDDSNNLIAIGKYPETYKPIAASEGAAKDLLIRMILEISNSSSVNLKIDPTVVVATKSDIQVLDQKITTNTNNIAAKVDKSDYVRVPGYATTDAIGTNIAYIVNTNPAPEIYTDGMQIILVPTVNCGANPTLNWNGLGAIPIKHLDGSAVVAGDILSTMKYQLVYYKGIFYILNDISVKIDRTDYLRAPGYATTTGTSSAYTITLNPAPTAYADGMNVTILPHSDCGANPTLNVNGLGALTILNQDGTAINAGDIKANKPLSLVRVGSSFFIRSVKKTTLYDRLYITNPWKYVGTNTPNARTSGTAQAFNGKIYYAGGNISGTASALLDIYDIATNTWISGASMPSALDMPVSVLYNSKMYVFGYASAIYIYDIASNTWSSGANPGGYGRTGAVAELYNGKMYVLGGTYGSYDICTVYDIAANTWSGIANMPSGYGRWHAHSALYNGIIYVTGGTNNGGVHVADTIAYNIANNSWATGALPSMALNTSRGTSKVLNGKYYIFGGMNTANSYFNVVEVYDFINGGTWTFAIGMPTARQCACSTIWDGKIYVIGGLDLLSNNSKVELFCPAS